MTNEKPTTKQTPPTATTPPDPAGAPDAVATGTAPAPAQAAPRPVAAPGVAPPTPGDPPAPPDAAAPQAPAAPGRVAVPAFAPELPGAPSAFPQPVLEPVEAVAAPAPAPSVPPVPPVPDAKPAAAAPAKAPPLSRLHWILLAAIAVAALSLRLAEPLSDPVIGAEDPYRHMERTWDLVQGEASGDYPPGINFLLFPFALMGPGVLYTVSRFLPAVLGTGMAVGVFFLCRPYMHPVGALASSLLAAALPELIRRTNILFPTGIDLALLPVLLLLTLRACEGSRKAAAGCAGIAVALFATHPWVLGLIAPAMLLFWLYVVWSTPKPVKWRAPVTGGLFAGAAALVLMVQTGEATGMVGKAMPRLAQVFASPGSITPLPQFVDYPEMLTIPALALAAMGALVAAVRRTRFGILALALVLTMLPVTLVDLFGLWYIPHRTVAYMAIGVVMLAGLAVSEALRLVEVRAQSQAGVALGALALVAFLVVPSGVAVGDWYRVYDEEDYAAFEGLDAMDPEMVVTGSWQARAGYRALTGGPAIYNPNFFQSDIDREFELQKHPELVVLVDNYARLPEEQGGVPTDFLEDWDEVGRWGDNVAYKAP